MVRRELPAVIAAIVAAAVLVLLIYVGSRGLKDFDSALVGYAVASVFAFAAIVYRYTRWITRTPTPAPRPGRGRQGRRSSGRDAASALAPGVGTCTMLPMERIGPASPTRAGGGAGTAAPGGREREGETDGVQDPAAQPAPGVGRRGAGLLPG